MKSILALHLLILVAVLGCGVNEGPVGTPMGEPGLTNCQSPSAPNGQGEAERGGAGTPGGEPAAGGSSGGSGALELPQAEQHAPVTLRKNCEKLQAAVEQFAARSGGRYPIDVDKDKSLDGKTVLDYVPGGPTMYNAYEGVWETPVAHTAEMPGEVGYVLMDQTKTYDEHQGPMAPTYVITGFGDWVVEVALSNRELLLEDAVVFSNCRTLQAAVEEWAALSGGMYPGDIGCSQTPGKKVVWNLLPYDRMMQNPATGAVSEPVDSWAVNPGETGYVPLCIGGRNAGYLITGVGSEPGRTILCIWYSSECAE